MGTSRIGTWGQGNPKTGSGKVKRRPAINLAGAVCILPR